MLYADFPMSSFVSIDHVREAQRHLKGVAKHTPLDLNVNLSEQYECTVLLKREDLQIVRSYKVRGAYNLMSSMPKEKLSAGVVCASAGNHAQGVAYSCNLLKIKGHIYMPTTTPKQKVNQVRMFGKEYVEVILVGDTFDDAYAEAIKYTQEHKLLFVHPFDDEKIIEGQATVALEILEDTKDQIDYIFVPIGGGGLVSGIISCFKIMSPETKIIGVEPEGAPSMFKSIQHQKNITLDHIDKFVDGAAVKRVGDLNFEICKNSIDDIVLVPEGKVCTTIIKLYNEEAIVAEPAGALSISALDAYKENIKGKTVVCVVSGSNNDLGRMDEIRDRSLLYEGLKHYFIINFPQRAGALREFLDDVLGPHDDITHFEYTKKTVKEYGPVLIGIELKQKEDYAPLMERLAKKKFDYTIINKDPILFNFFL
ncbi:MAG TPA: threonine ammonia-lyase [Cytophagaceae bacterium]|jgi:threonine dehydratase|nr:threonine ammonia-lyase [Cytophagaceae bacterium]